MLSKTLKLNHNKHLVHIRVVHIGFFYVKFYVFLYAYALQVVLS